MSVSADAVTLSIASGEVMLMNAHGGATGPMRRAERSHEVPPRSTAAAKNVKFTKEMNSRAEPIARGDRIDKIETLRDLYGGSTDDWSKMKTWDASGREIHYYQGPNGMKVGVKLKGEADPF